MPAGPWAGTGVRVSEQAAGEGHEQSESLPGAHAGILRAAAILPESGCDWGQTRV